MAGVSLINISKIYNKTDQVVKNINLEIIDKEFMVLVGPSGCGKSTTLRMVAGLEEITDGELQIDGIRVNDVQPKERDIAMVFQNYALYPHMTVFDNMAFGLKLRKFSKKDNKKYVEEAAGILDLTSYLDRRPKQLSGGQRQRVSLGRAIVRKPKVFLFDEPLSNLDAKLRVKMRMEIRKLHQTLKTTVIYVTHDQIEAMTLGDRITVMKDGIIQQVDTPFNLYAKPVNKFVAGFIGSPAMNFFKGQLTQNENMGFRSSVLEFTIPKQIANKIKSIPGKDIIAGIRPEGFMLKRDSQKKQAHITARIDFVETLGNESYLHMEKNGINFIIRTTDKTNNSINDNIELYFSYSDLHIFANDESQKRVVN